MIYIPINSLLLNAEGTGRASSPPPLSNAPVLFSRLNGERERYTHLLKTFTIFRERARERDKEGESERGREREREREIKKESERERERERERDRERTRAR